VTRTRLLSLLGLAFAVTLLNAFKPYTVDDAIYHYYAEHLARDPLHPYDFTFLGSNPAMETLVPLGLPYWWAGAIRLFGQQPVCWKFTLFPFSAALIFALHSLFRRFARGTELPLTVLLALSPVLLPCWNFMLDLPALALILTSLALFFRAADRLSLSLAVLAGVLGGLAMQTKYTAFVLPPLVILAGWLCRRKALALLSAGLMVALFTGWEGWLAATTGRSHFVYHLLQRDGVVWHKLRLGLPLISTLGCVAPWLGLLNLSALRGRVNLILGLGLGFLAFVLALALVPAGAQILLRAGVDGPSRLDLAGLLWGLSGLAVCASGLAVLLRRWQATVSPQEGRELLFLTGWLVLELLAYFALTPFPAVRRVLGVTVVGTLIVGGLAARSCGVGLGRVLLCGTVVIGVLLGLGFQALDTWEARQARRGTERAARYIRERNPKARVWYSGSGSTGFFYAEQAGLELYLPGARTNPGDWLVAEAETLAGLPEDMRDAEFAGSVVLGGGPPLSTMPSYHGSGTPLIHHEGPRVVLLLFHRGEEEARKTAPKPVPEEFSRNLRLCHFLGG
jgi:hypothetical protein